MQNSNKNHQSGELLRQIFTVSNVCPGLKLCSHCIISKKIGMVAFLSSGSGTNVTSRMGPTIAGMNFILWGPEGQRTLSHRNIIVLFEEAINHIFILNKERTNLIMWQTKQQQNMKPDNKKYCLVIPLALLAGNEYTVPQTL